jgi:glutamate-1-semialdehyde 2,1-aminomutase
MAHYEDFVPAGTHSNSRIRGGRPVVATRAWGSRILDERGRELLDFIMGNGAVILGHAAPEVVDAVKECVQNGLTTGVESLLALQAADALRSLIPEPGMVRFANTGTEAILHCLDIARAATGRANFAKAEGAYHGWAAPMNVSTWPAADRWGPPDRPSTVPGSGGLDPASSATVVFPFNNLAATEQVLRDRSGDIAAVWVEPVLIDIGYVPAEREYLQGLRELTQEIGSLLIFDETLTGFRIARGGAREHYGVHADLTVYGKAIANGYPLAAVEGAAQLMELTNPLRGGKVGFVGTYNGHGVCAAAALAALDRLRDPATLAKLDSLTQQLAERVAEVAAKSDLPVRFAGGGGHFQIYFTDIPVIDYRSASTSDVARYRSFVEACDREGIVYPDVPLSHAALSTAHTSEDIERLVGALRIAVGMGTSP